MPERKAREYPLMSAQQLEQTHPKLYAVAVREVQEILGREFGLPEAQTSAQSMVGIPKDIAAMFCPDGLTMLYYWRLKGIVVELSVSTNGNATLHALDFDWADDCSVEYDVGTLKEALKRVPEFKFFITTAKSRP